MIHCGNNLTNQGDIHKNSNGKKSRDNHLGIHKSYAMAGKWGILPSVGCTGLCSANSARVT